MLCYKPKVERISQQQTTIVYFIQKLLVRLDKQTQVMRKATISSTIMINISTFHTIQLKTCQVHLRREMIMTESQRK